MKADEELRATLKRCYMCHLLLDRRVFRKTSRMCIKCRSEYDRARPSRTNPRSVSRNNTDAARARKRRWRAKNMDSSKEYARSAVRRAVVSGVLVRPAACSKCGESRHRRDGITAIQGHHHNGYGNPLEVLWLCPPCHRNEHYAIAASKEKRNG